LVSDPSPRITLYPAISFFFSLSSSCDLLYLPSFPTRRSSDLLNQNSLLVVATEVCSDVPARHYWMIVRLIVNEVRRSEIKILWKDRKSTRLNSSHQIISYAVFCLKKKNETIQRSSAR